MLYPIVGLNFYHYAMSSFISFYSFVLNCILSGVNIATLPFFSFYLQGITFLSLHSHSVCLDLKWFSYRQHMWGSYILNCSATHVLIGASNLFTFKRIIDRYVLAAILLFWFFFLYLVFVVLFSFFMCFFLLHG